jgi:nucleoid-associated protein YgaU
MGNVEKWVVLGVLGLIVGILVISLNVDDPLKKDKVVLAGSPEKTETPKADPGVPPAAKDPAPPTTPPVLNAAVDTTSPPAPAPIPSGSILKTMDGLQESYMTDAMFYTWKAGDTFTGLAQRFYGDPSRLAILKRINEGRTDVQPGERVLVPVFDLDAVSTPAAPAPTPPVAGGKTKADAPKNVDAPPAAPTMASGARYHVVKDGESLWKIAKQELGNGARWNDIYNANRDVLSSPEALHTGLKLRVP